MKILFVTPHYNEWCHIAFAYSLRNTEWPEGAEVELRACLGALPGKALNLFAKEALDGGYDLMVQTCNDAGWRPDALKKLIADDKDVVSGWSGGRFHPFAVKSFTTIQRDKVLMGCEPDLYGKIKRGEKKGLERVYSIAGELAVFKVPIFKKLKYPYFSGVCNPSGEPTTDDFAFGCRCYDAGVEIWVDWDVKLRHHAAGMMTEDGKLRPM